MKKQAIIYGLIVAAACLVWLWPITSHPGAVPFWPDSEYTDLLVSHFPNAVMVNTGLMEYKQIPFWNPTILGGTPASADPLVGLWYPPRWLSFLFPTINVFNLLLGVHLIWAALGVFRLARLEGASNSSALIAGILFAGMPKLMAHLALGHIDLVFALSWAPWALASLRSMLLRIVNHERGRWAALKFGLVVGLLFLADPRWLLPLILLGFVYILLTFKTLTQDHRFTGKLMNQAAVSLSISVLAAAATAAPLALPLIQFTSLSTRRLMTLADQSLFSLPPLRVLSLVLPFSDVPEWVGYLGAALSLLWLAGIVLRSTPARTWGLVCIFFLLLALGPATPVFSVLNGLPGFQLLRVPARFLAFVALSASMGGAHAIDKLLDRSPATDLHKRLNLVSVAAGVICVALVAAFFGGQANGVGRMVQVCCSAAVALVLILGRDRMRNFDRLYPILWLALIGLDFLWMNSTIVEARKVDMAVKPEWLEEVAPGGWGEWRVFSTSYSLGQDQAAQHQIEMVDGVHPLQLSAYYGFVAQATGFDPTQYSVTLPPFPDGDPQHAWEARINAGQLGLLNTRYIISRFPLDADGLELVFDVSDFVYENTFFRPRAWIAMTDSQLAWLDVENIQWSPNRIVIQAEGPGRVVLSEVDYPGWEVALDGEPQEIVAYEGLLRSVDLPPGEHSVAWSYRPILTWIGLGAWGVLIVTVIIVRLRRWS